MEEEFDLREYCRMIRHNWILALVIFVVIVGATLAYTFTTPRIYQAKSTVMVTREDQTTLLLGTQLSTVDMETQREIVLSSSVLYPVYVDYSGSKFLINAQTTKGSNILEILVESPDPAIAQGVANEIASSYVNFTKDTKKQDSAKVNDFISQQLVSYKQELDDLNILLSEYKNISNLTAYERNKYQTIQREISAKSKLYDYLLSRREETNIAAQESSGNVKIIEYAYLPQVPIKPNVPLNIALGIILAAVFGIGAAMFKSQMRNTLNGHRDVESEFGPQVISSIPKLKKNEIENLGEDNGRFADSILSLRTNLSFHIEDNENSKNLKVIAVTSPQHKDGKSLVAASLALSMAKANKRVLIVDANMRHPTLSPLFNVKEDEAGLTNALLNPAKLAEYIRKTPQNRNLFFLPTGSLNASSIELASSDTLKMVFSKLKGSAFDTVIVDTSSLENSESTLIGAASDGVLLVVAHNKTEKAKINRANLLLKKSKANVIGAVINHLH